MKNKKTMWTQVTDKPWKRAVLVLAVLIAVVGISVGALQWGYQRKIDRLSGIVDHVFQTSIKAAGGVPAYSRVKAPYVWESWCIDTAPCPKVESQWYVAIQAGHEADFVNSIIKNSGYKPGLAASAYSDGETVGGATDRDVGFSVDVTPLDQARGQKPPYPASTGTEWRTVTISATYNR